MTSSEPPVDERMRELAREAEEFGATLSHDLQSPLRLAISFMELAGQSDRIDDETRHYIERATRACERLQVLMQDLIRYLRLPLEPARTTIRLDDVLDAVEGRLRPLLRERGARITRDPLPAVRADHDLLVALFEQLVLNGIVHNTREHPHVHVGVAGDGDGDGDGMAAVTVHDDGPGIDPALHDRLFAPLFTTAPKHEMRSGMGLALSRRIAQRFGGRLELAATGDRDGTTFTVALPAA